MTADGGLVDVRFVVLDPDKALDMMQNVNDLPVLLPEGTSAVDGLVAEMAARHDLNPGQTYFRLYRNPARALRPACASLSGSGDLTLHHVATESGNERARAPASRERVGARAERSTCEPAHQQSLRAPRRRTV